ncbi:MAG: metalloregulator ArsR/SmtB family transcription factor [Pseudomonadota bacterium]
MNAAMNSGDQLSATFGALADPTRRAMLVRLSAGEASVQELAKPFQMSMPAISKHLKVLEKAGLIVRGRNAQFRPCRLEVQPLKAAVDWMEEHRKEWELRFDRLDVYLQELQATHVDADIKPP